MIDNKLATVTVVGVGLIGTSIGLALRANGIRVLLADQNGHALDLAVRRGAGEPLDEADPPADLSVLAVPPAAVPKTLRDAQSRELAAAYTDVSSVKVAPVEGARRLGCDLTGFVPGHPMNGTDTAVPGAARADLFHGWGWVLCPDEHTSPDAVALVRGLAELCGAVPVIMAAEAHDRVAALMTHTPHLVAGAMAAALAQAPPEALRLGGTELHDVTRTAAEDPAIWTEILSQNARWVASALSDIAAELVDVCAALQLAGSGDHSFIGDVTELLRRGNVGRRRLTSLEAEQAEQD